MPSYLQEGSSQLPDFIDEAPVSQPQHEVSDIEVVNRNKERGANIDG